MREINPFIILETSKNVDGSLINLRSKYDKYFMTKIHRFRVCFIFILE